MDKSETGKYELEKWAEFKTSDFYKTSCDCGSDDHTLQMCIEYDKEFKLLSLSFTQKLHWWSIHDNIIKSTYDRIKTAITILLFGKLETETEFIFRGKNQVKAIVEALNESVSKLEKFESDNDAGLLPTSNYISTDN